MGLQMLFAARGSEGCIHYKPGSYHSASCITVICSYLSCTQYVQPQDMSSPLGLAVKSNQPLFVFWMPTFHARCFLAAP